MNQEIKVTNEVLDYLASLKMPSTGLEKICLSSWDGTIESAFDSIVIERLLLKVTNLKTLDFHGTKLDVKGKEILVDLIAQIITTSTCLTKIFLDSNDLSGPMTTVLLNALSMSPSVESIESIHFFHSADLKENDACIALADFLANATSLKEFRIGGYKGR